MKLTLPTYFLHSRHGDLSVIQNLIFSLNIFRQISFLRGPGRRSHILGAKDEIRSVPKQTVLSFFLCSMLLFLKSHGFFKNCNKSETISGEILYFALNISAAGVWRFFDEY